MVCFSEKCCWRSQLSVGLALVLNCIILKAEKLEALNILSLHCDKRVRASYEVLQPSDLQVLQNVVPRVAEN